MTVADCVIILGPNAISGPGSVDESLASVALDCIDDRLALVDDRAVPVEQLWRQVMSSAIGETARTALVLPTWWAPHRRSLVVDAVPRGRADVVVLRRSDVLRSDDTGVVVEISDDLVAVYDGEATPAVIPRTGGDVATSAAVLDRIESPAVVVIDVPSGVVGARALAEGIGRGLRARGLPVSVADDRTIRRMVGTAVRRRRSRLGIRLRQPRIAVVAVSVVAVVAFACAAVGAGAEEHGAERWVTVVEGRVSVEVPTHWRVERVTTGPGSARLQVVSPSDSHTAIHVTQSPVPMQQSLTSAAEALHDSLATQPQGVFVEFTSADRRADRAVISYREVRPDHVVDWTLFLDDGVRIAIGCQGPADRSGREWACERAIRSARAVS